MCCVHAGLEAEDLLQELTRRVYPPGAVPLAVAVFDLAATSPGG